jgi:hypothetical protein
MIRAWFRWVVMVAFASLSLTSVALAANEQTSKRFSPAKAKNNANSLAAVPAPIASSYCCVVVEVELTTEFAVPASSS